MYTVSTTNLQNIASLAQLQFEISIYVYFQKILISQKPVLLTVIEILTFNRWSSKVYRLQKRTLDVSVESPHACETVEMLES